MLTVHQYYLMFLNMGDESLKAAVDMYNNGGLNSNARLALEIIDNVDSPPVR